MNSKQLKNHDRLLRSQDYKIANPAEFPAGSRRKELMTIIDETLEEVDRQAAAQAVGLSIARESTINKKAARAALRKSMVVISRAALTLEVDNPGIAEQYRLPHGDGDQVLLNVARAFVTNATPIEAQFISNDLHADFLTKLRADITRLQQMISVKHQHTETHVTATAAIDAALERGMKALRQLDLIMRNLFQDDEVKLRAWRSASRAEHHTRKNVPEPPPPTQSAP